MARNGNGEALGLVETKGLIATIAIRPAPISWGPRA